MPRALARHVHQKRLVADLLDVRHGFLHSNSVKPLARHVHQTCFCSNLLNEIFINLFTLCVGKAEDHDRDRRC